MDSDQKATIVGLFGVLLTICFIAGCITYHSVHRPPDVVNKTICPCAQMLEKK